MAGQALTEKQLMKVAKTMGKEWEQAAIHLGLKNKDLDDIKAEHRYVAMQKQNMLVLWTRRIPPGEATANYLLNALEDMEDLPVGTRQLLRELVMVQSDGPMPSGSSGLGSLSKSDGPETHPTQDKTSKLILSSEQFKTKKLMDSGNMYAVMAPAGRTRMALLITNEIFTNEHLSNRDGAKKDEEDMRKLLSSLGYNVEQKRDLSGAEMDEAVKRFSKDPRLAMTDSVFVVIMSHGVRGAIAGIHHSNTIPDLFPIDNIYNYLDSGHCPKLINKPKVIIIQACRGDKDGSVIYCDGPGKVPEQAPVVKVDAALPPHLAHPVDEDIKDDGLHRVHKEKDLISLLSCTVDTRAYRHAQQGSFLIKYIVEIFNCHAHEDHLDKLFTKVLKRFEDEGPSPTRRQMAVKDRCTFTKKFYLFPGL